jgi:hypothetical protein
MGRANSRADFLHVHEIGALADAPVPAERKFSQASYFLYVETVKR